MSFADESCVVDRTFMLSCPAEEDSEMAITTAALEERVNSNVRFFWAIVAGGLLWMGSLSVALYNMNNTLGRLERGQADSKAHTEATLRKIQAATDPVDVLEEIGSLNQKEFALNLPALQKVV
jgi:hypothetical protein